MEGRRRFILKGAPSSPPPRRPRSTRRTSSPSSGSSGVCPRPGRPPSTCCRAAAQRIGKIVDEMSGGRLKIQVFAGGELMPPFGCFDAASQGTIECFMGAPYYWAGKEPGLQWFSAVPFGLNPRA